MLRRSFRSLVLVSLSACLLLPSACKRAASSGDETPGTTSGQADGTTGAEPRRRGNRSRLSMPRKLRLPADPSLVVHLQSPQAALLGLQRYSPELMATRELLTEVAKAMGGDPFELALAEAVDLRRPWDVAMVDGQLIVHLPISRGRMPTLQSMLADKPPVGRFGAVDLQRTAGPGPKLAWLDAETRTLTLADTDRGLATGRHLAKQYGAQDMRVRLQGDEVRKYVPGFLLDGVTLAGAGPHDFEVTLDGVPSDALARLADLESGALTGLLQSSRIAVGASSKYAKYDQVVRDILADGKRTVNRQNFLVKPVLEDLHRRLGSVLRSWNGRALVGVGPKNHVLLAFGAEDPQKMGGAVFHLIRGVTSNLELARSVGLSVPKIRFQQNKSVAAGLNVSVVALEKAKGFVPSQYQGLINERGDLRVAMAFSARAGAAVVVAGPDSHHVLEAWLEDVAKATPGKESLDDYVAGTFAVDPEAIAAVVQGGDPGAVLGLSADREPTRVTVQRKDTTITLRVKGPQSSPAPRRARG